VSRNEHSKGPAYLTGSYFRLGDIGNNFNMNERPIHSVYFSVKNISLEPKQVPHVYLHNQGLSLS